MSSIEEQLRPRLRELGFDNYWEYLRSSHWHGVRRGYRASQLPQDCICGATEKLELHHKTYDRLGEEQLDDLTPLCRVCHKMVHDLVRRGLLGLDLAGFLNEKRAEEHRKRMERRVARRAAESSSEVTKRRARSLASRLRSQAGYAVNKGIDIDDHLDEIERAIDGLDRGLE